MASAIRIVAERGDSGEAYNVADRRVCTMEDVIELIAGALDTSVEETLASGRDGSAFDPGREAEERLLEVVAVAG